MAGSGEKKPIRDINLNCLRGCLGLGVGWGLWQTTSTEYFVFGWMALVFAGAGICKFGEGLWGLIELIKGHRKLKKFERKGTTPKADAMAQTSDLKKAGMVK